jgi:hypothetical protein
MNRISRYSIFFVEFIILATIGIWMARDWINLDPQQWVAGNEYILGIHSHFIWEDVFKCGLCFLWNGNINGGNPSFVELQGAPLNPFVFLPILFSQSAVIGSKITILISLWIAGLAQWWLSRLIGLGRVARMWSAIMAMVGSHLIGRMDMGLVTLMLSVATGSMVIPAAASLAINGRKRDVVILALVGALFILSGQGYIQIALPFILVPALLFFIRPDIRQRLLTLLHFLLAVALCLLVSSLFLVPLLHFLPFIDKYSGNSIIAYQSLNYLPLNLVIGDVFFYQSTILGKQPYAYLYVNYIGWIPVILGILALRFVPSSDNNRRWLLFLITGILLSFLVGSGLVYKLVFGTSSSITNDLRYGVVAASMAIPFLLGLSGWAIDRLLGLPWPKIQCRFPIIKAGIINVSLVWIMAIPLIVSVIDSSFVAHNWLYVGKPKYDYQTVITHLNVTDSQWIGAPDALRGWMEFAHIAGLKTTGIGRPWFWSDRKPPLPYLLVIQGEEQPPAGYTFLETISDVNIFQNSENAYAAIRNSRGTTACSAKATDGFIDVACSSSESGTLVIKENAFDGWQATIDGNPTKLIPGVWLSVELPAGSHIVTFRYYPWDVPLGLLLTAIGVVLCVLNLWRGRNENPILPFT